jgi:hypothetical protein
LLLSTKSLWPSFSSEDGLCVRKPGSFPTNRSPKMRELHFMFKGRFGVSQPVRKSACEALWRIFSSNKSSPANRKKGFNIQYCTSCLPQNKERNFCIKQQRIRTLFKNLNKNFKIFKHIAVNILS